MNRERIEQNLVLKFAFNFSLFIIEFCDLAETNKKFVVARQLLKSGTSIAASAIKVQHAESKAGFIHKFKIDAKEGEETRYWLLFCDFSKNYPNCKDLLIKIEELNNVIGKIVSTSKRKHSLSYLF